MATITHLQTNFQQPEQEVDEHGIKTVYTKPTYKTTDGKEYDSKDDAIDHQKIVNFVDQWRYSLHGKTMRGNGWEHVYAPQDKVKSLIVTMIQEYQDK